MITWIWCIAKTIALAPQRRPSSKHAAAIVSKRDAAAAELGGDEGRQRPAPRAAPSIVSAGKRASRSTASAFGAAHSSAIATTASQEGLVAIDRDAHATASPLARSSLTAASIEAMLSKTLGVSIAVGELDVEVVLEREHHVDARVGGHARLVEVGVARERVHVDGRRPWSLMIWRISSVIRFPRS